MKKIFNTGKRGMNILYSIIEAKPHLGFLATGTGVSASILAWLGLITPIIGFLVACAGLVAGIITVMIKWKEWRNLNK